MVGHDLYFTGGHIRVDRLGRAFGDDSLDFGHPFETRRIQDCSDLGLFLRPHDDLHNATAIANLQKDQPPQIPPAVDPALQFDSLSHILPAQ